LFSKKITTAGTKEHALAMERVINIGTISIALAIQTATAETTAKTVNKIKEAF
jgi:hypothetical protein